MSHFLAKSEPLVYSISDLQRDKQTTWDGVRNPQALQAIRAMKKGDTVLIYHSGGESAIVGWAKVVSAPGPDPKVPDDAKLTVVDLAYGGQLTPPTTLKDVKESGMFPNFALVRQSRLSTMAVTDDFLDWLRARYPKSKF
jgi:predicted RNA-binding protein with PUA-like domain